MRAGSVVLTFKPLTDKFTPQSESGVESQAKSQSKSQPESRQESQQESGVESGAESEMALQIIKYLQHFELSKKDIALKLGKSRPTRYLNDLMQRLLRNDVVEYTIPDKPNSRLQKYRMTQKGKHVLDGYKTSGEK